VAEYTNEEKFKFLAKAYFGVSDNPSDDVNPFTTVEDFLNNTVGKLRWGSSPDARQRSKKRFSYNLSEVLKIYRVILKDDSILKTLQDENQLNRDVVNLWMPEASFPPKG
jgi:hypothetical protein